jgi:electron transfer flavoprotein beta subunit
MGADRGVIVDADEDPWTSSTPSPRLIAAVYKREGCDLLIAGKLSQDNEGNQIAQRVAGILGAPQACFAATVEWDRDRRALTVSREVDDGVETKRIPLARRRLCRPPHRPPNQRAKRLDPGQPRVQRGPRLASLKWHHHGQEASPSKCSSLGDLGLGGPANERAVAVKAPPARKAGQIVGSVDDLFDKLTKEAKVL